ncbi:MAG: tetratricopeptide repeat protein [Crocinitomicaceae bacterium]
MLKKQIVYLVFFLLNAGNLFSQNRNDSLRLIWQDEKSADTIRFKAIQEYYLLNSWSQSDSALKVSEYHLNLAKKKNSVKQIAKALNLKGTIYTKRDRYDEALELFKEAAHLAKEANDIVFEAGMDGNIGNVYLNQNKYREAIHHFSKGLKVFQEQNTEFGEASMYNNLGIVYNAIGNYDLALEYYNKVFELKTKIGNTANIGHCILNIGTVYYNKEKYEDAIYNFEKALPLLQSDNNLIAMSSCYLNLASAHKALGQKEKAFFYVEESIAVDKKSNNQLNNISQQLLIVDLTLESNVDEAAEKGENILRLLSPGTDHGTKQYLYELLYKCYKVQGKLDLSLSMHELYTVYNDSLQIEKNNFLVTREAVKNEFEVKLYEKKLENEKEQAALKLQQIKTNFLIISSSTIIILLILFYFQSNIKKNQKKRALLLQELDELRSNSNSSVIVDSKAAELDRLKIETAIARKLNETDWKVLNILLVDPLIPNKEIAEKAFLSIDGIGSSLRRMYEYFNITETKYKKIALLTNAIKLSSKI